MARLALVWIATMLLVATHASDAASSPLPTDQSPATLELSRKAAELQKTVTAQGRMIRTLRRSLRASVGTPGGLARAFLCIHSFEASWTDSNAPYWGGLQFDAAFMSTYGGAFLRAWGTADHWQPFIQIAVAENAYLSGRGFSAWPATAHLCGLA